MNERRENTNNIDTSDSIENLQFCRNNYRSLGASQFKVFQRCIGSVLFQFLITKTRKLREQFDSQT